MGSDPETQGSDPTKNPATQGSDPYVCIAPDVKLGKDVRLSKFINLYGCEVGDETKIGAFGEIQKNASVCRRCKISSHTFICEGVTIEDGVEKPVKIGIRMNNSSGLFQVDGLLKAKLRGSGLEPYVEVIAHIDTENEKRLVSVYRLEP